ncbi:MAG: hypothetical protein JWQ03_3001 [Variovorax sp.]|nr:hypothetical protein [Variovorax sp.]
MAVSDRVVLHIDRLVLTGIPQAERDALVHALRDTLAQSMAEPGFAQRLARRGDLATLRVATLPSERRASSAQALGHAAARGIAGSLKR